MTSIMGVSCCADKVVCLFLTASWGAGYNESCILNTCVLQIRVIMAALYDPHGQPLVPVVKIWQDL